MFNISKSPRIKVYNGKFKTSLNEHLNYTHRENLPQIKTICGKIKNEIQKWNSKNKIQNLKWDGATIKIQTLTY